MPELRLRLASESEAVQRRRHWTKGLQARQGVRCYAGPQNNGDPAMSTTGVEFRAIRESRGLTVDRIASATRIPVRYIEALERDDMRALPARPYLRGFVAAYGRELGLDPADDGARYFPTRSSAPEQVLAVEVAPDEPGYTRPWASLCSCSLPCSPFQRSTDGDRRSSPRNPRWRGRRDGAGSRGPSAQPAPRRRRRYPRRPIRAR